MLSKQVSEDLRLDFLTYQTKKKDTGGRCLVMEPERHSLRQILALLTEMEVNSTATPDREGGAGEGEHSDERFCYGTWTWGGRIHPVPEDFQFPKCNVRALWDFWWDGNRSEGLAQFRLSGVLTLETRLFCQRLGAQWIC